MPLIVFQELGSRERNVIIFSARISRLNSASEVVDDDDAFISRDHPTATSLERRRSSGSGEANPSGLCRTAQVGQGLYVRRTAWPYAADHGPDQRSLHAPDRLEECPLAGPRPFLRSSGSSHEAHPCGLRPRAPLRKAGRGGATGLAR